MKKTLTLVIGLLFLSLPAFAGTLKCDDEAGKQARKRTEGVGPDVMEVKYLGKYKIDDSVDNNEGNVYKAYFVKTSTESFFALWMMVMNATDGCKLVTDDKVDQYSFD